MICFLTSAPDIHKGGRLYRYNGQVRLMRRYIGEGKRFLFVASNPVKPASTDHYADIMYGELCEAGLAPSHMDILDARTAENAGELVQSSDFMFLAGGHVPTQNAFFREIGLRQLLLDYPGAIIGCSAGTMNSADMAYVMPEDEGEAKDPSFVRFAPGLGLTRRMVIPHYYHTRRQKVDGLRAMEEIAYPDSMGRTFTVFPDGSFLFYRDGEWEIRGEAYELTDGVMTKICSRGEVLSLGSDR